MLSAKTSRGHQLIRLGRLENHIALSNPIIDVRTASFGVIGLPSLVYSYFKLDQVQITNGF